MLRWARALPRWMRLLPGVLGKPLVGAVGRSLVVERRFSFLFGFVLEVLINPKFISLFLNACYRQALCGARLYQYPADEPSGLLVLQ